MSTIIRNATIDDAASIARVNIESWKTTYRGLIADAILDEMTLDVYVEKWRDILVEDKFCRPLVAEAADERKVIGYIFMGKNRSEEHFEAEIYSIYLLKEYQGQGIGTKLFLKAIQVLKDQGISSVLLYVLASNMGSRKFYESFKPNFMKEDIIQVDGHKYNDICYGWNNIYLIENYQKA
jgi:ribosomal protein S18 acetylase RimI-like enzyme